MTSADPHAIDLAPEPVTNITGPQLRSVETDPTTTALDLRPNASAADRASTTTEALPEQLDRYVNETMAAHAAVVLAKTQATAARAEARDLSRQVSELTSDLEAERAERQHASSELAEAGKTQAIVERDRAVAEARADEVRKQVEQERVERSLLVSRIGSLEADRDEALAAMGWWSRRRYARRRAEAARQPRPTVDPYQSVRSRSPR